MRIGDFFCLSVFFVFFYVSGHVVLSPHLYFHQYIFFLHYFFSPPSNFRSTAALQVSKGRGRKYCYRFIYPSFLFFLFLFFSPQLLLLLGNELWQISKFFFFYWGTKKKTFDKWKWHVFFMWICQSLWSILVLIYSHKFAANSKGLLRWILNMPVCMYVCMC